MPYFAAALARASSGWTATEVDLDEVGDFAELIDMLRDLDDEAERTLLFLEEDDVYVAIVRVDGDGEDPRVFVSDIRAGEESRIAAMLLEEAGRPEPVPFVEEEILDDAEEVADDDDRAESTDIMPAGDSDLLTDLGTGSADLLALCAHEGLLPADVITAVTERAGCLDELEDIRGG